jgi:hypothetical protein
MARISRNLFSRDADGADLTDLSPGTRIARIWSPEATNPFETCTLGPICTLVSKMNRWA